VKNLNERVFSLAISLTLLSLFFLILGINVGKAYYLIFIKPLTSLYGLSEVIVKMIPLLLIGVGLCISFRAGFWNIGAEGQLILGGIFASFFALYSPFPYWPILLIGGFLGGALWIILPSILKAKLKISEVITTLMLNYVAILLLDYLLTGPWKGKTQWGFPYTDPFPESAILPLVPGTRVHWPTLIVGVISSLFCWFLVEKSVIGYRIKVVGQSEKVARYAKINITKIILISTILSGGLAGIAGAGEVAGIHYKLLRGISIGYGFSGIIVAWLANLDPLESIFWAFFMALLFVGGDAIQISFELPFGVIDIFNGILLISILAAKVILKRWKEK